jgi:hypothetical protein
MRRQPSLGGQVLQVAVDWIQSCIRNSAALIS